MRMTNSIRRRLRFLMEGYYSSVLKLREPFKYVFILAHMRSGSSLLVHLLSASPDVCGYGETHIDYRQRRDLLRLSYWVLFKLRRFPLPGKETYVLDKIVHDSHLRFDDLPLLCASDVSVIFLIREPRGALRSLMKWCDYESRQAVDYYTDRLSALVKYAKYLTRYRVCALLTYESLLSWTDGVFDLLERYLELRYPLSGQYPLMRSTGKPGIGDWSAKLLSGRICGDDPVQAMPPMDARLSSRAQDAFSSSLKTLRRCCISGGQGSSMCQ